MIPTTQVKNSFSSIGEIDSEISPATLLLKLSVTGSAVRYFVLSETHSQVIFFGDYTLHHVLNPTDLAQRIERIFEKDEILQLPFRKVLVGLDEKYSLVPTELSFMIDKKTQLSQHCGGSEIVFEPPVVLQSTLGRLFRGAGLLHLNSTFFNLLRVNEPDPGNNLYVNVASSYFDIIYFSNGASLKLMNRYNFQAATDFIYFLLLCCEELKIDREITNLVLMGEVNEQSKIYELCYRYFRNVDFIRKPESINFTRAFDAYPMHLHFNLYNLSA